MKQIVIQFLNNMQSLPKTPGLHRIRSLMNRLDNPQEDLKIIHVAGTNGKGSVCAMLKSVLVGAGYNVGLFTSPHLKDYNERMQIQHTPIDDNTFGEIGLQVKHACRLMLEQGEEVPSIFEFLTAMAFLYFARNKVDIVVLETGLGGRYDATNIISCPLASVITSIGKDHMSLLGDTIEKITREKAGIIKENCPTILYNSDNIVYNIINYICENRNSMLFSCKEVQIINPEYSLDGTIFTVTTPHFEYDNIRLQLIGEYQIDNAITVLMTLEALRKSGYNISNSAIYRGLHSAKWPGRMEVIQINPTIIIDGAHNEQSVKAFVRSLPKFNNGSKIYILLSILKDKDYISIIDSLLPLADTIIATQSSNPRALSAKDLYTSIKSYIKTYSIRQNKTIYTDIILEEDILDAYERAKQLLNEKDMLCCVGSLYLAGEIRDILQRQEDTNV